MNRIASGPEIRDLENSGTDFQHLISRCEGRTRLDEDAGGCGVGE
jgi:hypothetical protein